MIATTAIQQVGQRLKDIATARPQPETIEEFRAERDRLEQEHAEQNRLADVARGAVNEHRRALPQAGLEAQYKARLAELEAAYRREADDERWLQSRLAQVKGRIESFENRYRDLTRDINMRAHDHRLAIGERVRIEEEARQRIEAAKRYEEQIGAALGELTARRDALRPNPL